MHYKLLYFCILVLVLVFTPFVYARDLFFGFHQAVNMSMQLFPDSSLEHTGLIAGYGGSAFINIPLGDRFSMQLEALFTTRGGKTKEGGKIERYHLSYLDFPLLIFWNKMFKWGRFFIDFGGQISIMLGAVHQTKGVSSPTLETKGFTRKVDLGLPLGCGLQIDFKRTFISLEMRTLFCFIQQIKYKSNLNFSIYFLLGYGFVF
jgi:hypothetical protein